MLTIFQGCAYVVPSNLFTKKELKKLTTPGFDFTVINPADDSDDSDEFSNKEEQKEEIIIYNSDDITYITDYKVKYGGSYWRLAFDENNSPIDQEYLDNKRRKLDKLIKKDCIDLHKKLRDHKDKYNFWICCIVR